jgi:hypothetical protein
MNMNSHSKLDESQLVDAEGVLAHYQMMTGSVNWAIALGRHDIQHAVASPPAYASLWSHAYVTSAWKGRDTLTAGASAMGKTMNTSVGALTSDQTVASMALSLSTNTDFLEAIKAAVGGNCYICETFFPIPLIIEDARIIPAFCHHTCFCLREICSCY